MGLFDSIGDALFGDAPSIGVSGAFPNLPAVGGAYSDLLLERLQTPVTERSEFQLGSSALRDLLSQVSGEARMRAGDRALAGGYFDSGALSETLTDVDRAELQSFSSGIRDLILGLEAGRTEGVLPYLSGGAGEFYNVNAFNAQQQSSRDALLGDFISSIAFAPLGGGFPSLAGLGAAAIFGRDREDGGGGGGSEASRIYSRTGY